MKVECWKAFFSLSSSLFIAYLYCTLGRLFNPLESWFLPQPINMLLRFTPPEMTEFSAPFLYKVSLEISGGPQWVSPSPLTSTVSSAPTWHQLFFCLFCFTLFLHRCPPSRLNTSPPASAVWLPLSQGRCTPNFMMPPSCTTDSPKFLPGLGWFCPRSHSHPFSLVH